ncbi:EboA domain-containing protein [Pedobacter sp. ASV1-7]|uniref:EboA domain-containing protein n=1 Tax=Pedobacter sp. ASV1-7 TaxID=3145237 RepID=UPI0032E909D4
MLLIDTISLKKLSDVFLLILRRNLRPEALEWLLNKMDLIIKEEKSVQLHLCFAHLPRFATKQTFEVLDQEVKQIECHLAGFTIHNWTLDKLSRVWLLMQIPSEHKEIYLKKINSLFATAEMNEQIVLYTALPLYNYPEEWVARCEEGIRSNIGTVLEAIMYHNPYPAQFLSEPSWNQLVLKAFFTEKDVNQIIGLKERMNENLSATLQDYIQERLAASRTVAPEIYQLTQQMNP